MSRIAVILAAIMIFVVGSASGITKVAARYNNMSFYGGYSSGVGEFDGFWDQDWNEWFGKTETFLPVNGSDLVEPSFHIGATYGQLRNEHVNMSIGLNYTKIDMIDTIVVSFADGLYGGPWLENINVGLFDIEFNVDYYINHPVKSAFSPYVGVGFQGGMLTISAKDNSFDSESMVKLGMSARFGAEIRIVENIEKGSSVSLVSNNWYNFAASDGRPKYMNFGIGLRYYFRP